MRSGTVTLEDIDIVKYTHRALRPLSPDRVRDVTTREVVSVHPETPLGEVVRMLVDRDFRVLPVVDGEGRLVGIVTNRDLVERGRTASSSPSTPAPHATARAGAVRSSSGRGSSRNR